MCKVLCKHQGGHLLSTPSVLGLQGLQECQQLPKMLAVEGTLLNEFPAQVLRFQGVPWGSPIHVEQDNFHGVGRLEMALEG